MNETVKSILASIQWDNWKFYLSAKPLLESKVGVISHEHGDHIQKDLGSFDDILYPYGLSLPPRRRKIENLTRVNRPYRIGKMVFAQLGPRFLTRMLRRNIDYVHVRWWLATYSNKRVLFVGDVDLADVPLVGEFIKEIDETDRRIHGVLLPSFAYLSGHGSEGRELSSAIGDLAFDLRQNGVVVGGLPHPVGASWADFNAVIQKY